MPEPLKGALVGIILRFGYGGKWTTQRRWPPIAPSGRDSRGLLNELPGAPAPARYARLCGRSTARAFPVTRSCKSRGNLHDYGRQASLLLGATLRESPAEAGRGAVPPLTPRLPARRRSGGRRGAPPAEPRRRCSRRAFPVVGEDPADAILGRTGHLGTRSRPARQSGSAQASRWPTTGWPRSPGAVSSPENRPHGDSGRLEAGRAESEAAGSRVTHELDHRRGRSTPGFALSREELDIAAVEDRAGRVGGEARHSTGQLPGLSVVSLTDGEERPQARHAVRALAGVLSR